LGDIACVSTQHDLPGLSISHSDKVAIERAHIKSITDLPTIPALSIELRREIIILMEKELRAAGKIQPDVQNIAAELIHEAYQKWLYADIAQLHADARLKELTKAGIIVPEKATTLKIAQLYEAFQAKKSQTVAVIKKVQNALATNGPDQVMQSFVEGRFDPLKSLPEETQEAVRSIEERIKIIEEYLRMSAKNSGRLSFLGQQGRRIYPWLTNDEAAQKLEEDMNNPERRIEVAALLAANGKAIQSTEQLLNYKPFILITNTGRSINGAYFVAMGFTDAENNAYFNLEGTGANLGRIQISFVDRIIGHDGGVVFDRKPYRDALSYLSNTIV
jgi:hypothetical protein